MRPYQYMHLADVVEEHRKRLSETAEDLARRNAPLTELEARLLVDAGSARLLEVEHALRHEAQRTSRRLWQLDRVHGATARLRSWTRPRIGRLEHYEPQPIRLPLSYFRTPVPSRPPSISVVTPSYGHGRFVDRTIHSVVSQRYPALEYHVQDGGSMDETMGALARFSDQLTSWASEPDSGQADAINRGFGCVSGEIMAWLNSDDLLLPGSLAAVGRFFADHPDVDVIYGHRIMVDEHDGQIGAWVLPRHSDRALTFADYIPQETLFWRRRIWDAAGGYVDSSYTYALDWELLLRFRDAGAKMVRLPRFIGAFRVHDEQKTTAQGPLGLMEMDRLRERVHGRHVTTEEVIEELKPYFARHIVLHSCQRFVDRLPLRRGVFVPGPPLEWSAEATPPPTTAVGPVGTPRRV